MTSTPKSLKHVQDCESPIPSPLAGPGAGGHKASFKSTKLARRARSFKDDFLGKISQIRSPTGPVLIMRSNSPKNRLNNKNQDNHLNIDHNKSPIEELDDLWKQIQIALKHFRDVVSKQILEMLSGNGTIVLDTVWLINLTIKSSISTDSSSTILSATNHMYQSVARLIKLCDDALIDEKSSELNKDNVDEIVAQVEDSVKDLIKLAQEKILQQQQQQQQINNYKTTPRTTYCNNSLEMPAQRNSLPDIPLTPRERQILEQTSCSSTPIVRNSHSSESILIDSNPPPKPPLPDGRILFIQSEHDNFKTPPPLPPKKKILNNKLHRLTDECYNTENSPIASSLERVSIRSKSPEDSISLLSASAGSLDSMLNHSREEDEIKNVMEQSQYDSEFSLENNNCELNDGGGNGSNNSWEDNISLSSNISNQIIDHSSLINDYNRLSNIDSGIISSQSCRLSFLTKSSQQSSINSQFHLSSKQLNTKNEMIKTESVIQNLSKSFSEVKVRNQSSSSSSTMIIKNSNIDEVDFTNKHLLPPAIPLKTKKKQERQPSPYDNVPDNNLGEVLVTCQMHQSHQSSSNTSISSTIIGDGSAVPPPLPPKKKHIMAYMEMFGNCSHANEQEFMRHSVHMVQSQWAQTPTPSLPSTQSCSFSHTSHSSSLSHRHTIDLPSHSNMDQRIPSPSRSPNSLTTTPLNLTPPALPPKQRLKSSSSSTIKSSPPTTPQSLTIGQGNENKIHITMKALPDLLEHTTNSNRSTSKTPLSDDDDEINNKVEIRNTVNPCDIDLMEELNVEKWLILKKPDEEGPDIRGGPIDALIIQATKATKNGVFTYQEAFLTTYRTFISPYNLICKLIRRHNHFYFQPDKKARSREAFALIVRVVSDLTATDLTNEVQCKLMNFVQQLISSGELTLAKALRVKHLERYEIKQNNLRYTNIVTSLSLSARNFTLLDFKSEQIAEQMTLLDAELFMKIEIPEVLIWAQEQNEERSPNLTRFTEHFNKMSYWARTKILTTESKEIREKYFFKFIKIMKHLRKINNFNSYLALLSALDSAPVRRLEWQKNVQDGLKEYCALIDSSSSFRAYRQALAETQPPCIPYIGLVLQDLTFVHIGNSNLLPDGYINFSKRWQQFNILENMKKFKKAGVYTYKKNERIIQFFQNFDEFIGEDAMWQLSESIKPRGGKKSN